MEVARWLLSAGAAATATNADRNTPLHYAAQSGEFELASELIAKGAPPAARNADGDSAFLLACFGGHRAVCELLRDGGEAVDQVNEMRCSGLLQACAAGALELAQWLLPQAPSLLDQTDASDTTPLMHACEQGRLEVVQWLLEQGAKPTAAAAQLAKSQGHADLVKLMKKAVKAHKS